jgi:flagellar protein FlaG
MTSNIASAGAVPDPTFGSTSNPVVPAQPTSPSTKSNAPTAADLRLVIEEDEAAGCFVYKTVDWRTGEVVQQLPREQLVKLREADNYAVGDVIKTSA